MHYKSFRLDDLKALDSDKPGHFAGKASVYNNVDLHGEVVVPGAFTKCLAKNGNRVKVLNQHNPFDSIGMALLQDTAEALLVADGSLELELQSAKEAYVRVKGGLVDGISIGYETTQDRVEKGIRYLTEIDLWEVSLVTFPANPMARVTDVKSLFAALGLSTKDAPATPTAEQALDQIIADLEMLKGKGNLSNEQLERVKKLAAIAGEIVTVEAPPPPGPTPEEQAEAAAKAAREQETKTITDSVRRMLDDMRATCARG